MPGYHDEIQNFKRELIRRVLREHGDNRTYAAAALGLQRTYLLRLLRELTPELVKPRPGSVPAGQS